MNIVDRYEPQVTLKTISDEIVSRGVYSYPSPFEDGKFLLITEVDDVHFNGEIKRGFGRAQTCRIPVADLIEAADVETYLAGVCSRLKESVKVVSDHELKCEVRNRVHEAFRNFERQYLPHMFSETLEAEIVNTRKRIERHLERQGFNPDEYEFEFDCISRDEWNRERKKDPNLPVPVITARFEWKV